MQAARVHLNYHLEWQHCYKKNCTRFRLHLGLLLYLENLHNCVQHRLDGYLPIALPPQEVRDSHFFPNKPHILKEEYLGHLNRIAIDSSCRDLPCLLILLHKVLVNLVKIVFHKTHLWVLVFHQPTDS